MKLEDILRNQAEIYKSQDNDLERFEIEAYKSKAKFWFSILFFLNFPVLFGGLLLISNLIYSVSGSDLGGLVCFWVFIGGAWLGWVISGLYYWFQGTRYSSSWMDSIGTKFSESYSLKRKINQLKKNKEKREEFFQFYELYQTDENFRDSYNAQLSNKRDSDEFLKRLEATKQLALK